MTREQLDALLERNLPGLRAFVRLRIDPLLRARESCSDVVQSICREILQYAATIDYGDESEFRRMLYVAVLNKIRKRRRYYLAEKRHPGREDREVTADEAALIASYRSVYSPSEHAIGRETVELLERAFDRLPEHYREVLTLAKIAGLPHRSIAEEMNRTVPSIHNLISRAMVRLAEELLSAESDAAEPC